MIFNDYETELFRLIAKEDKTSLRRKYSSNGDAFVHAINVLYDAKLIKSFPNNILPDELDVVVNDAFSLTHRGLIFYNKYMR